MRPDPFVFTLTGGQQELTPLGEAAAEILERDFDTGKLDAEFGEFVSLTVPWGTLRDGVEAGHEWAPFATVFLSPMPHCLYRIVVQRNAVLAPVERTSVTPEVVGRAFRVVGAGRGGEWIIREARRLREAFLNERFNEGCSGIAPAPPA